jgi:hypothetical protein
LAASGLGQEGNTTDPAAQWRSLCERFREIRRGASRHDLMDAWRQVAKAPPDTPARLAAWQQLDEQIRLLDDQELDYTVRGPVSDDSNDGSDDDWDDWGDEYGCPAGKCDRTVRSSLGITPRCELFDREMTKLRAGPGA